MVNTIVRLSEQPGLSALLHQEAEVVITLNDEPDDGETVEENQKNLLSNKPKGSCSHSRNYYIFRFLNCCCCCFAWIPLPILLWALFAVTLASFLLFLSFSYLFHASLVHLALAFFFLTVLLFVAVLVLSVTLMIREELDEEEHRLRNQDPFGRLNDPSEEEDIFFLRPARNNYADNVEVII